MSLRLGIIQLAVGATKIDNLNRAAKHVHEAAQCGAKLIALPECCNSPYGNQYFPEYAEPIPGDSTNAFSKIARDNGVYLIAGSIPERDGSFLYNTSTIYNPAGVMIGKFRKVHLFDIDVPGKITFQESKTLTAGQNLYSFDVVTEETAVRVGVGICYDIRFPEMAMRYRNEGCQLLVYPGAFNMTTGPAHWELLTRSRALDNQMYVATVSPARDEMASYVAWGHSTVANPWGEVIAKADHSEEMVFADIDPMYMQQIREQIPILKQGQPDVYSGVIEHNNV